MAFAGIQLAVDLPRTAVSLMGAATSMMKPISVDDVGPAALHILESLGSRMPPINADLLPLASDALGGGQSLLISRLRFEMGLSSHSIANDMRKSPWALTSFLLLTALGASMDHEKTGDVLVELLTRSGIIRDVVIGRSGARRLVEAFAPYSQQFRRGGHMPVDILKVLPEAAYDKIHGDPTDLFTTLDREELARILLEVFDAASDKAVSLVQITGHKGAQTIVGALYWLYPDETEVNSDGKTLIRSRREKVRIAITLVISDERHWTVEALYTLPQPTSLFKSNAHEDRTELWNASSFIQAKQEGYAPYHLLCSIWDGQPSRECSEQLRLSANIALGLVDATRRTASLERHGPDDKSMSVSFGKICSSFFLSNYQSFPMQLGFPEDSIDPTLVKALSDYFSQPAFVLAKWPNYSVDHPDELICFDREACDGKLHASQIRLNRVSMAWSTAMVIANLALLSATQTEFEIGTASFPFRTSVKLLSNYEDIIYDLLGPRRSMKASDYLQLALSHAHSPGCKGQFSDPVLAISGQGRICYLGALSRPPKCLSEAFEIKTQPGVIRWKEDLIRYIYDSEPRSLVQIDANPRLFIVDEDSTSAAKIGSLLTSSKPFEYLLREGERIDGPHLICMQQSRTDPISNFISALINFALAVRMEPSNRSEAELLRIIRRANADRLHIKHPDRPGLNCQPEFLEERMRAVATYNRYEDHQFLKFGTSDSADLISIVQEQTGLLDCIAQAVERYNTGWIIWANP